MPTLLFQSDEDPVDKWLPELQRELPNVEIQVYPEIGALDEIDYALVWKPPGGLLASLPNLKLIHSIGAGVDHLLADPELPKAVPIVRMVDTYLRDQMAEYAVLAVLYFHRNMDQYGNDRISDYWQQRWPPYTPDNTVGILGLGAIGADIAGKLRHLSFKVMGWSRSEKSIPGVECLSGDNGLNKLLSQSNYLICVLPLTPETAGILNFETLSQLPANAVVINLGRGGHQVENELITLLDQGHLRGAFLDVFEQEPLPVGHPIWKHPKIMMTPHVAGVLVPRSCAKQVATNIAGFEAGEILPDLLDLETGY